MDSLDGFTPNLQGHFTFTLYNWPSESEVNPKDMGKCDQYLTSTKHNEVQIMHNHWKVLHLTHWGLVTPFGNIDMG